VGSTTSDYSKAFTRIRDAVAALPVDSAVLDGEAIVLRPDKSFDFEALRSRQGQAEAIMVAYDIMLHRLVIAAEAETMDGQRCLAARSSVGNGLCRLATCHARKVAAS
jgi:hypothetical protein